MIVIIISDMQKFGFVSRAKDLLRFLRKDADRRFNI